MTEEQKIEDNTKRIIASNLTAAYFAAVEKQTRSSSPIGAEREELLNQIKRVYWDMRSLVNEL